MKEKAPLIIWDMDGVLVENRSSWRAVHDALGTDNEDSFLSYMRGDIDDLEFMRRDIERWKTAHPGVDRRHIEEILFNLRRTKGLAKIFGELGSSGCSSVILSGGIDLLAKRLSEVLGLNGYHANGILFDEKGKPTGEGILKVPLRNKGAVMDRDEFIKTHQGPIISIGDSEVDISMFKRSDLSIAFRPETDRVREESDLVLERPDLSAIPSLVRKRFTLTQ